MAVRSYVLINVNGKNIKNALKKLRASKSVVSADAITGPYDVVAIVEAENVDMLGRLVTQEILKVPEIERSLTCIVMKM